LRQFRLAAPLLGIGWLIKLAAYLGLLMWLFDLNTTESVLLAVITFALKIAAGFLMMLTILGT